MAGNLHSFVEISYHFPIINPSFANVRAYAIRPYTCSFKIKRIFPILILENSPFNHTAPAINTYSLKFKHFGVETMNGN